MLLSLLMLLFISLLLSKDCLQRVLLSSGEFTGEEGMSFLFLLLLLLKDCLQRVLLLKKRIRR